MNNGESKPNLLVTASTFPRFLSDTEPRFVFDLCRELKESFSITVLAPLAPGIAEREVMDGVRVVRYRYAPLRSMETLAYPGSIMSRIKEKPVRALLAPLMVFGLYRAIRRMLRSERFDLVHAHWLIPQGIVQSFFGRGGRGKHPPFVITCHGGDVFSLNGALLRRLKQRALKRSQGVTVVSEYLKAALSEKYTVDDADGDGGVDKRLSVISMGCYTKMFDSSLHSGEYFRSLGIDNPVVLFVGRLAEKKGLEYLIRAVASDLISGVNFTLAVVGEGPLEDAMVELCRELGIFTGVMPSAAGSHAGAPLQTGEGKRVVFLGKKTHEELCDIYASADIFCAPSVTASDGDRESFGLVMIEAASSGLPVITTRRGEDEVVIDGKTGFVVDEKNPEQIAGALVKLLESEQLRREFGRCGMEHARQFDWEVIGQKYTEFLMGALVERGCD